MQQLSKQRRPFVQQTATEANCGESVDSVRLPIVRRTENKRKVHLVLIFLVGLLEPSFLSSSFLLFLFFSHCFDPFLHQLTSSLTTRKLNPLPYYCFPSFNFNTPPPLLRSLNTHTTPAYITLDGHFQMGTPRSGSTTPADRSRPSTTFPA